jgi:hypothetical protein
MNYLDTDQYTRVKRGCPMSVDVHVSVAGQVPPCGHVVA